MAVVSVPEMTLGVRLYMSRRRAGKDQTDMAKALGVSRGLVSNWERDLAEPRATQIVRWAEITEVPAPWLLAPSQGYNPFSGNAENCEQLPLFRAG